VSPFAFSFLPQPLARGAFVLGALLAGGSLVLTALTGSGRAGRATAAPSTPPGGCLPRRAGDGYPETSSTTFRTAARPPRIGSGFAGWAPLLCANAADLICVRSGLGPAWLRAVLAAGLGTEALTLAAFLPWAARHRAWHASDYAHFLALLPGTIAAFVRERRTDRHASAFAAGSARRRAEREERARAALAAWRADQALRRHSPGYAASGARIEAATGDGGVTELRLRFPSGIPDAAAEAAFREHAASGLLARAAGVASADAALVERPDGTLALRIYRSAKAAAPDSAAREASVAPAAARPAAPPVDDVSPLGPGLPPLALLEAPPPPPDPEDGAAVARRVLAALQAHGVRDVEAVEVRLGPTVTTVIVRPPAGPGAARVLRLAEDLRFRLGMAGVMVRRAEGRPGCAAVEVPSAKRAVVSLRAVLAATRDAGGELVAPLGVAPDGTPLVTDIAEWPHGLVAGATGSGKSVLVNALLVSLLLRYPPERLRLVLIDPKRVELALYRDLPHLARPLVTGAEEAVVALEDAVAEMRRRYALLERAGVRKLPEHSARAPAPLRLPRLLVVIDEAQALMEDQDHAERVVAASKELAAMGRAAGAHLLYGTQYPLASVIPSALKANTPTRIALQVRTRVNSQVILDQDGAEALLGAGDMLACVGGGAELRRAQSPFVSEDEVRAVVGWWAGRADGGDCGGDGAGGGGAVRGDALELLRGLAAEVVMQEEGLRSAHVAFVRRGEYVAVRREHVERVLRRLGAEPGPVLAAWRQAGWIRTGSDGGMAISLRAPWGTKPRMLVLEWGPACPGPGGGTVGDPSAGGG
jgi:hypothetical protein